MAAKWSSFLCLLVLSTTLLRTYTAAQKDVHSLSIDTDQICDDGKIRVDEDLGPDSNWKCGDRKSFVKQSFMRPSPVPTCSNNTHFVPTYQCMETPLSYSEQPPLTGDYRPVAPQYGEYQYLPPQRWLHGLRLGAVAFLYHPCTPVEQVNGLREVARSCLWKHLLTPYPHLSPEQPLALVSWGCIYRMEWVEPHLVMEWLQQNALRTDDSLDATVGAYNEGLILESDSNIPPHTVCPNQHSPSTETTPTEHDATPPSPCSDNSTHSNSDHPTSACNTTNRTLESSHERLTILMALAIVILLLAILLVLWRLYVSCSFRRREKGKYKSVSKYFPVSLGRGVEGMVIPEMGIPKDGLSEREKLLDESDEDEL